MKRHSLVVGVALAASVLVSCSNTADGSSSSGSTSPGAWAAPQNATPAAASTAGMSSAVITTGIHDAATVCQDEVLSSSVILVAALNGGTLANPSPLGGQLINALGYQNPVYTIASHLLPVYLKAQPTDGQPGAIRAIQGAAPGLCAAQNNPVLTAAEVSELAGLASPGDAAVLQQITYFGDDSATSQVAATATAGGPITDPVQVCAVENVAEFDIRMVDDGGIQRLGSRLADSGYSDKLIATYYQDRGADGDSAATGLVAQKATELCSSNSAVPVLSQQDVSDLASIASPADAASLQLISYFAATTPLNPTLAATAQNTASPPATAPSPPTRVDASSQPREPTLTASTVAAAPNAAAGKDPALNGPVTSGTPADVADYQLPGNGPVAFVTPSGNTRCNLYASDPNLGPNVECDISAHSYPTPVMPPGLCVGDYGLRMGVGAKFGAMVECRSDPLVPTDMVLQFGYSVTAGGVACLSTKSGVRCESADGRGFIVSTDELVTIN